MMIWIRMKGVLIVDDDEMLCKTLKAHLSLRGIPVLGIASDGIEAIDLFENLRPDIVLLDITMPNLDGFGALETIKRIDENANVIMLTAHTDEDHRFASWVLRSADYVTKPYEVQELVDKIHKLAPMSA